MARRRAQESVHSAERAALLAQVWALYTELFGRERALLAAVEGAARSADAALRAQLRKAEGEAQRLGAELAAASAQLDAASRLRHNSQADSNATPAPAPAAAAQPPRAQQPPSAAAAPAPSAAAAAEYAPAVATDSGVLVHRRAGAAGKPGVLDPDFLSLIRANAQAADDAGAAEALGADAAQEPGEKDGEGWEEAAAGHVHPLSAALGAAPGSSHARHAHSADLDVGAGGAAGSSEQPQSMERDRSAAAAVFDATRGLQLSPSPKVARPAALALSEALFGAARNGPRTREAGVQATLLSDGPIGLSSDVSDRRPVPSRPFASQTDPPSCSHAAIQTIADAHTLRERALEAERRAGQLRDAMRAVVGSASRSAHKGGKGGGSGGRDAERVELATRASAAARAASDSAQLAEVLTQPADAVVNVPGFPLVRLRPGRVGSHAARLADAGGAGGLALPPFVPAPFGKYARAAGAVLSAFERAPKLLALAELRAEIGAAYSFMACLETESDGTQAGGRRRLLASGEGQEEPGTESDDDGARSASLAGRAAGDSPAFLPPLPPVPLSAQVLASRARADQHGSPVHAPAKAGPATHSAPVARMLDGVARTCALGLPLLLW